MPCLDMTVPADLFMATLMDFQSLLLAIRLKLSGDPKLGMVIDFGDLKKIVKETVVDAFDHALGAEQSKRHMNILIESKDLFDKLILVDYQPTSENLVADFAGRISGRLPEHIKLFSLKLRETATSYAEWFAGDQS